MTWHLSGSVDAFAAAAEDYLRARPVENTVLLTVTANLRQHGKHRYGSQDPVFGWHSSHRQVDGAFLQTPPFPAYLSAMPTGAANTLAEALTGRDLTGVNGLTADTEAFTRTWRRTTGAPASPGMRMRLYRLDKLTPPEPPPSGASRQADPHDRELLIGWWEAFEAEAMSVGHGAAASVDDGLSYRGFTLWQVDDQPVSMAMASRPEAGMVRIVAVYTPPEHRGNGYAGAATAVVTQSALDRGARDVVLNTDLANKTSNALYQRLGYRPIEDRMVMEFR
ncbi:GNAT family N-acetyltransferase [Mangrovihabitans endophyticus]|uniref:N-acetyltransferase n=1 Tax=Mangrovihabitans endophyticus TaxID=1751298 RepID=A0A8J3BYF9_9ACTN|nr:GNAT family N-acetyltransferase [Mangrovihabitans endophyticus]GGK93190.1 N-acetyltransferase [Mangrovihabitans endophyticus]